MDPVTISIELPRDLYDAILARSAANERTIRAEVVAILTGQLPPFPAESQPALAQDQIPHV